ncbi:SAM-dependent methyltransferase [Kitasatospora sp. NPDC050463]|uniref:SAM-dependent methyltransferase n=1 Tax=Kitasatospora sp. NPDC050463 TaxID=3155786 RepID=UPI0033EBA6FD
MPVDEDPLNGKIDLSVPSAARMYDFLLGGTNNFLSDRLAVEDLLKTAPSSRELALNNRAFLRRVVKYIASHYQIRQFIDHGSGLPTQDNVHQVAQQIHRGTKVVYVDNDPVVLSQGRALLDENDDVAIVAADMTKPAAIRSHPKVKDFIDFSRPVAALFVSVLHCVPDPEPARLLRETIQHLAPGSVVVICQLVSEDKVVRDGVTRLMAEQTNDNWGRVRTEAEVRTYFDGLQIEPPGLVDVTDWRPDSEVLPRQRTREWIEFGGLAVVS